jgi:hypothetical protein
MSTQAIVLSISLGIIAGLLVGYVIGHRDGRNLEWLDHYFAAVRKERARHDAQGKFCTPKTNETHTEDQNHA